MAMTAAYLVGMSDAQAGLSPKAHQYRGPAFSEYVRGYENGTGSEVSLSLEEIDAICDLFAALARLAALPDDGRSCTAKQACKDCGRGQCDGYCLYRTSLSDFMGPGGRWM
jgi:hypothetical protein